MVNWQVTATTIHCDAVNDEVTLLVRKDWSAECIGYRKYGKPGGETQRLLKNKSKQMKRRLQCDGPECSRVVQYKEKLMAEEARGAESAQSGTVVSSPGKDGGSA